jgi:hypothetical protein
LDIAILRCPTATFSRLSLKDTGLIEDFETVYLVKAVGVKK